MASHGVHAATDVAGFGLLGHLVEMVRASDVGFASMAITQHLILRTQGEMHTRPFTVRFSTG